MKFCRQLVRLPPFPWMLLAMPLVFLSYMSSVLFILGELVGILEKARTWGRHLPAASSPENGERHFAHGEHFCFMGKKSDLFIKKILVPRSER